MCVMRMANLVSGRKRQLSKHQQEESGADCCSKAENSWASPKLHHIGDMVFRWSNLETNYCKLFLPSPVMFTTQTCNLIRHSCKT